MRAKDGKGVKHDGIKVEFVGSIGVTAATKTDHDPGLNMILQTSSTTAGITTSS